MSAELDIESAIRFVQCRQNHECSSEISRNWSGVINCLKQGNKFEDMWNRLREDYGCHYYKHPIDEHVSQMSPIYEILDRLFTEFFGSRPETRKEKLTNIIQAVYNSYVHREQVHDKEKDNIIGMLVKLRDEEEDE